MSKPEPDKAEDIRRATREANEVLKDLRAAVKEARSLRPDIVDEAEARIKKELDDALKEVHKVIDNWHARVTQHVTRSANDAGKAVVTNINRLARLLMGKEKIEHGQPFWDLKESGRIPPFDVEEAILEAVRRGRDDGSHIDPAAPAVVLCRYADLPHPEADEQVLARASVLDVRSKCDVCGVAVLFPAAFVSKLGVINVDGICIRCAANRSVDDPDMKMRAVEVEQT
jgi:vacuolar-type H+-ATPase subunit H